MTNPYEAPSTKEARVGSASGPAPLWLRVCVGALLFTFSFAVVLLLTMWMLYEFVFGDTDTHWYWLSYLVPLPVASTLVAWYIRYGMRWDGRLQISLAIGSLLALTVIFVVFS